MNTSLPALAFAMSLTLVACSGTAPIDKLTESSPGRASATPSASAAYDPKPASPTPGGVNKDGDYVGDTNSWAMFDDPKTAFPVTIDHAYGSTTIPSQPKRLVTLDHSSTGYAALLVRVPAAFPKATEGATPDGLFPDMAGLLESVEIEGGRPTLLDLSKGVPVDEVKAAKPDVILAVQDGVSEAEYKELSKIAPVVVQPGNPGQTSEEDMVLTIGKALGQYNHAKELYKQLHETTEHEAKELPTFAGKSVIVATLPTDASAPFTFYPAKDVRTQVVSRLGFVPAPVVTEPKADAPFKWEAERASQAESDVVIAIAADQAEADKIRANPAVQALPAAKQGNLVVVTDPAIKVALQYGDPMTTVSGMDKLKDLIKEQAKLA